MTDTDWEIKLSICRWYSHSNWTGKRVSKDIRSVQAKSKKYNMVININKTKCLTVAKEPTRCKQEINEKIVEQILKFYYLWVLLTS